VHVALNGLFFPPAAAPDAPSLPDAPSGGEGGISAEAVLKSLADEMEITFRLPAAARLHQERVVTARYEPDPALTQPRPSPSPSPSPSPLRWLLLAHLLPSPSARYELASWLDYSTFLMRSGDAPKAEECTREAVALNGIDAAALTAHGCVLAARGDLEGAEVFLKGALDAAPSSLDAWLLMAALYELMGRKRDAKTAHKHCVSMAQEAGSSVDKAYLALAESLLPLNPRSLIEQALQLEAEKNGTDPEDGRVLLCRAQLLLQAQQPAEAAAAARAALAAAPTSALAHQRLGHALLLQGDDQAGAIAAYEAALKHAPQPPTQVLLLLGRLQLDKGEWTRAKEVFLQACRLAPSCSSWLGAGAACLRLKHRAEAEECLSEANVLNNREPAAWGQLALLCVQQERLAEAEQALHHALKLELPDAALLTEVGGEFANLSAWAIAETCARRSLVMHPAAPAHQLLGDVLVEQRSYDEAAAQYANALALVEGDVALSNMYKALLRKVLGEYLGKPQEAARYA